MKITLSNEELTKVICDHFEKKGFNVDHSQGISFITGTTREPEGGNYVSRAYVSGLTVYIKDDK